MKIITLEEHFETATIRAAQQKLLPPREAEQLKHAPGASGELMTKLLDLDQVRLQQMDRAGIDMQIISYSAPGTQILPASEAVPLTKDANDQLAEAVKKHPDRFAGFAALPTPDPDRITVTPVVTPPASPPPRCRGGAACPVRVLGAASKKGSLSEFA